MTKLYKLILVTLLVFSGLLLVLAGTKLIQLSLDLLLYLGIGLLSTAIVYYFLYPEKKGGEDKLKV